MTFSRFDMEFLSSSRFCELFWPILALRICLSSCITAAPWISAIHLLEGSNEEVCYSSAIASCDRQGQLERIGIETSGERVLSTHI